MYHSWKIISHSPKQSRTHTTKPRVVTYIDSNIILNTHLLIRYNIYIIISCRIIPFLGIYMHKIQNIRHIYIFSYCTHLITIVIIKTYFILINWLSTWYQNIRFNNIIMVHTNLFSGNLVQPTKYQICPKGYYRYQFIYCNI